jgi:hypothetical protein
MARQRNIEEEFRAVSPQGFRGIPTAPPIAVGVTGSGGADSAASMSQAAQEIAQLTAQFQQQSALIQANTQALQNGGGAHSGQSTGSSVASGAEGFLGSALHFLSPVASGLLSLFGIGSSSAPAALPYYVAPPSVQMGDTLRTPAAASTASTASSASSSPQVTVNVSAMDSQSFMDRSNDIASAVREAMLNLHPINDVVANL